jgi:NAD+ kinase
MKKIVIVAASSNQQAIELKDRLVKKFNFTDLTNNEEDNFNLAEFDLVIAVGGDGLMLKMLHKFQKYNLPIYGINFGTIGFLMNKFEEDLLIEKINNANTSILHPLKMITTDIENNIAENIAINEVSLLRQTSQTAKIKILINNKERIDYLAADGVLVSTAAGSTAYNFSVNGPIIPLESQILALTPISPFRPRKWRGAIIPANSEIKFEILEANNRKVSASADSRTIINVKEVKIYEDRSIAFKILFDPNHSLEERIIAEQFIAN